MSRWQFLEFPPWRSGRGKAFWEKWELWVPMWRIQGLPKYGPTIDDVTWQSETNADGQDVCQHGRSVGRKILKDKGGMQGLIEFPTSQGDFLSPEESKLQTLLCGISPLFNLFMLPAVRDTGNCKCFLDDDVSTSNYIISICWLESWWRRAEGRTLKYLPFFSLFKDSTV